MKIDDKFGLKTINGEEGWAYSYNITGDVESRELRQFCDILYHVAINNGRNGERPLHIYIDVSKAKFLSFGNIIAFVDPLSLLSPHFDTNKKGSFKMKANEDVKKALKDANLIEYIEMVE